MFRGGWSKVQLSFKMENPMYGKAIMIMTCDRACKFRGVQTFFFKCQQSHIASFTNRDVLNMTFAFSFSLSVLVTDLKPLSSSFSLHFIQLFVFIFLM